MASGKPVAYRDCSLTILYSFLGTDRLSLLPTPIAQSSSSLPPDAPTAVPVEEFAREHKLDEDVIERLTILVNKTKSQKKHKILFLEC